jgi:hypothetical protein
MRRMIEHIGRLVLKGFSHEERHAFFEGLCEGLTRVFAEPDAKPSESGAQAVHGIAREIKS